MSLPQHKDAGLRFEQQSINSRNDVLPFIEEMFQMRPGMRVMEIGCGEGGVLLPFLEKGCHCTGVDLVPERIALAEGFLHPYLEKGSLQLIAQNVYDVDFYGTFKNSFDLIILKDAIEHIPEQEKLVGYLKELLKPEGHIFLGFPPWYMPLGGHQQICKSRFLSMFPYVHLLPAGIYKSLLKMCGEDASTVKELLEIKSTGITIERFERIVRKQKFTITNKRHFFINPIYRYKFNLKPQLQSRAISAIPVLRNFFTTCVYYLITPAKGIQED